MCSEETTCFENGVCRVFRDTINKNKFTARVKLGHAEFSAQAGTLPLSRIKVQGTIILYCVQ